MCHMVLPGCRCICQPPATHHFSAGEQRAEPACWHLQPAPARPDWEDGLRREVQEVFTAFALYGAGAGAGAATPRSSAVELDGARFAKLCRDSGLLSGRLNSTAVDLVFSKAKPKVLTACRQMHRGSP